MKREGNIGLGIALGVVFGLLFHNLALGICFGIIFGAMIPAKKKDGPGNNGTDQGAGPQV
ncbi:hypothetical protein [Mucilaginibacter myungsuensis]|uniref:Glycine zipper-like domain-containing protein n=1 Tax=Mucilaginibacter myungsuensis TaxID=649104 RepID=A0A929L0D0_9SPHI|nr:hypothetical protein [Mucilaginibacter myungsuensis]MBE9663910.1 hypothetical protein [Mucilaginibacter myungsuensis]MDN3598374.1 hypothetical protein [Mucilaginibacter myungsuensis]